MLVAKYVWLPRHILLPKYHNPHCKVDLGLLKLWVHGHVVDTADKDSAFRPQGSKFDSQLC